MSQKNKRKIRLKYFNSKGYLKVDRSKIFDEIENTLLNEVWDEAANLVSSVGALSDVAAIFWSYRINAIELTLSEKIDRTLYLYNLVK